MSTNSVNTLEPSTSTGTGLRAPSLPARLLGFLELLVVTSVSMVLIDQVTGAALRWVGLLSVLSDPAGVAVIMMIDVCVGTALWMLHRRRSTRSIAAVMLAIVGGFAVPLLPFWVGAFSGVMTVIVGHALVIPALGIAVALLPRELSTGRTSRPVPERRTTGIRIALERVANRWPTVLALLLTFSAILDPGVAPAWVLLIIGSEYLIIGALRKQFRDRRLLGIHVAGAVAYAALALLTTALDPALAGILIGIGWILHAAWDLALHRADVVVWRWYAEACAIIDLVVGASAIAAVVIAVN